VKSVVRRSSEVSPEAGSFVYLGDFAHITYAQLQVKFPESCSEPDLAGNSPKATAPPGSTSSSPPPLSARDVAKKVRDETSRFVESSTWLEYLLGGFAKDVKDLPGDIPSKSRTEKDATGYTSTELSEQVLQLPDTCPDFTPKTLNFSLEWTKNAEQDKSLNARNILSNEYYLKRLSKFEFDSYLFLDLVGRVRHVETNLSTRPPLPLYPPPSPASPGYHTSTDADDYDYYYTYDYYDYVYNSNYGSESSSPAKNLTCSTATTVSICTPTDDEDNPQACFCAVKTTGLPRTLRAYMDPHDPLNSTAVMELIRLWPDYIQKVTLDEMQGGLDYLLTAGRGMVGKFATQLVLTIHAYDRRNPRSSVLFYLKAERDTSQGELSTSTLTLTVLAGWT
ncbi:hypothetical protein Agub_g4750, partial [Astrephomene gubernaculifera]